MPAIYAYMLRHTNILIVFFFFNDTATTEIYTLSLHDALPISRSRLLRGAGRCSAAGQQDGGRCGPQAGDKRENREKAGGIGGRRSEAHALTQLPHSPAGPIV